MCEHELKLLVWNNEDRGLYIPILNLLLGYLTFSSPLKNFKFLEQSGNWWHNRSKVFDKTPINLCHPVENLDLLGVSRYGMFTKAWTLWGSIIFPFLNTIKPRIVFKNIVNAHLFGLRLIPNSLHLKKHLVSFSRCVDRSLEIFKSSTNIFMNTSMHSWLGYCPLIGRSSIFDTKHHHNPHEKPFNQ